MLVKRLGLAVASLLFGYLVTFGLTILMGTTIAEYGGIYTFFTALSIACALGIWLDKFLGTELLPK